MTRFVVLDAGPIGLLTRSRRIPEAAVCFTSLRALLVSGYDVIIPEISDYEVRRELIRLSAQSALNRLDALHQELAYAPITTSTMRLAAIGDRSLNDSFVCYDDRGS